MCKTIKQKIKFKANPQAIFEVLTSSKALTALSGKKATISKNPGGRFSMYGGFFTGINVDFADGERIVMAWRKKNFPAGIFSMVTINLNPSKTGGTDLVLTHRGVPKDLIPKVESEWRELYWNKIKKLDLPTQT